MTAPSRDGFEFLHKNKLHEAVFILGHTNSNLKSRLEIIQGAFNRYEAHIQELLRSYDPHISHDKQMNMISPLIRKGNYCQLDIMRDLSVLVETFFLYFLGIEHDLKQLPKILKEIDSSRAIWGEIRGARNITLKRIFKIFKLLDPTQPTLTKSERAFLRKHLSTSAKNIRRSLQSISNFQIGHNEIYNKYKHTLSEVPELLGRRGDGLSSLIILNGEVKIRRKKRKPNLKRKTRIKTFLVDSGPEVIDYYKQILNHVQALFDVLLHGNWLFILNGGRNAYAGLDFFNPGVDQQKLLAIVQRIPNIKQEPIVVNHLNFRFSPERYNDIRQKFSKFPVTSLPYDIYSKPSSVEYWKVHPH